nr:hypothetical protein [uncultured Flavobacterium sp.]
MKNLLFLILVLFFDSNSQAQNINSDDNKISHFFQVKAEPVDYNIVDWKKAMMNEMKEKWSLSFLEVVLIFIVEKDGTISNLKIYSEEWKPSEEEICDLLNMINLKGKWIPGSTNNESLRTAYNIKMIFQQ